MAAVISDQNSWAPSQASSLAAGAVLQTSQQQCLMYDWQSGVRVWPWPCATACSWPLPCSCSLSCVHPAVSPKVLKLVLFVQCWLRTGYNLYPDKLSCTQGGPDFTQYNIVLVVAFQTTIKHDTIRPWCWGWMTWSVPLWSAQAAIYLHVFCWLCVIYVLSIRSTYDQLQQAVTSFSKFKGCDCTCRQRWRSNRYAVNYVLGSI